MFEKEAEEYYYKNIFAETNPKSETELKEKFLQTFQDGAEFGYNKANEWHYVKDGDLPKKTGEYLVYRISGYGCKSIELIQYNSSRHFWCVDCQNEVYAWKELPKFPEVSE